MSRPIAEPAPAEGASSIRALGLALSAPEAAFRALAARPVWALALAVLVVLGMLALGVGFSKVTADAYARMIEEAGQPVPPQFEDDPERFMGIVRWTSVASAAVVAPVVYLALAGIFLVAFRLLGSEIDFRRSLSVTLHGMLPLGVAAAIGLVIALARTEISPLELQSGGLVMSNLGFLAGEETSKTWRALLTSADLFSLWAIALLAIGYRIVARVSPAAAWGTVAVVWGAGVLIKVALAAAF